MEFNANTVNWRFWFESPSILTLDPHFTHTCTFFIFIILYLFLWSIMLSETIFGGILVNDQNMSVFLNKQDVLRSSYFLNKQDVLRSSYFLNKQDVLRSSYFINKQDVLRSNYFCLRGYVPFSTVPLTCNLVENLE